MGQVVEQFDIQDEVERCDGVELGSLNPKEEEEEERQNARFGTARFSM